MTVGNYRAERHLVAQEGGPVTGAEESASVFGVPVPGCHRCIESDKECGRGSLVKSSCHSRVSEPT